MVSRGAGEPVIGSGSYLVGRLIVCLSRISANGWTITTSNEEPGRPTQEQWNLRAKQVVRGEGGRVLKGCYDVDVEQLHGVGKEQ